MKEGRLLCTLQEAIVYLNVSRSTVYRFVSKGELKAYKVGKTVQFLQEDVKALIRPIDAAKVE